MIEFLKSNFGIGQDFYAGFVIWFLILMRILVMVSLTPFLGGRGVSGRTRLVVSIVLATFVFSFFGKTWIPDYPEDKSILFALFFKEVFVGLAIGITAIMTFFAIEAGGRIVDNQRGSANAQIFLPQLGQVSIFGLFQYWLGLAVFLSVSGHIPFLHGFLEGFRLLPVLELPQITPGLSPFLQLMIRMSADVLVLGMQLAAPVLIGIFLTDLVLGIANKMAPQIPVFEMGFLMKGYVGVIMVYVSIFVLVSQMEVFFDVMNKNVLRVFHYLGT